MLDRGNAKTKGENTPQALSHEDVAKLLCLPHVRNFHLIGSLVERNHYDERDYKNLSAAQVISIGEKVINGLGESFFPLILVSEDRGKSIRTAIRLGASVTLEKKTDITSGHHKQEIFLRRQFIKATPLMQAVANYARGMENIKAIIAGGADINHVSSEGFTALHVAAAYGAGRIRALIQLGADPNIPLPSGKRLIDVASPAVRKALEKSNVSPSPAQGRVSTDLQASKTPVVQSAEEAFQRVLGLLRSSGASLQSDVVATHKDTPPLLLLAHRAGFSPETLKELVALGADPNFPVEGGLTLLGAALIQAHRAGVDLALAIGTTRIFTDSQVKYILPRTGEEVSQDDLTRIALQRLQTESDPAFREACELFKRLRSPYQFYLFSEALQEVSDRSTGQMGLSFYQIASNMLYIKPKERPLGQLLEKIRMSGATQGHHN
jgi:ankyrin repeat protein